MAAIALLLGCIITSASLAQSISLPLAGYYRAGAYMPVNTSAAVSIHADTSVNTRAAGASIVPVFVYGAVANEVIAGNQRLPLHALSDDDRLIGRTTRDESLLAQLFPSHHVIPIDLDPSNPLPGSPLAWDALDAAVLDAIDPKQIAPLLATGMTIAVRSEARPDETWPWRRLADAWVLRPPVSDQPSLAGEEAYEPTFAWRPGHSPASRQMIVIVAVLASCMMLAMALWRSRWNLLCLVVCSIAFFAALLAWRAKHPDIFTIRREDRVAGNIARIDRWTYQTSPMQNEASIPCDGITWPVFASESHAASMKMILECDERGNPLRFSYRLPAQARMAFLTRTYTGG